VTAACAILLGGCPDQHQPIATNAVYCAATDEPPLTGEQKREFLMHQDLWRPLVEWLDAFVSTRRKRCG
jgi:hypothetical protein